MSKQLERYQSFSRLVSSFMTRLCIWPTSNSTLLYKVHPYMCATFCSYTLTKMVFYIMDNYNNLRRFARVCALALGITAMIIKVFNLKKNFSKINREN